MSALHDLLRTTRDALQDTFAELDDTDDLGSDTWQLISDALTNADESLSAALKLTMEED